MDILVNIYQLRQIYWNSHLGGQRYMWIYDYNAFSGISSYNQEFLWNNIPISLFQCRVHKNLTTFFTPSNINSLHWFSYELITDIICLPISNNLPRQQVSNSLISLLFAVLSHPFFLFLFCFGFGAKTIRGETLFV